MKEKLKGLRSQKFVGAVELADKAAKLVSELVPAQTRGSVSELPDERMVRYYSAGGLLSAPEARQGPAAVYGYLHLLQLLVIKKLQAEHLPIRKIKELVEHKDEEELERLLNVERSDRSRPAALQYLESLLGATARSATPVAMEPTAMYSQSLAPSASPSSWARVEIEPGLELHIRDDYAMSEDAREKQRLARKIVNQIEIHGRTPRK
jgi:DNA-binding transcriptional MerR regulator